MMLHGSFPPDFGLSGATTTTSPISRTTSINAQFQMQ